MEGMPVHWYVVSDCPALRYKAAKKYGPKVRKPSQTEVLVSYLVNLDVSWSLSNGSHAKNRCACSRGLCRLCKTSRVSEPMPVTAGCACVADIPGQSAPSHVICRVRASLGDNGWPCRIPQGSSIASNNAVNMYSALCRCFCQVRSW